MELVSLNSPTFWFKSAILKGEYETFLICDVY